MIKQLILAAVAVTALGSAVAASAEDRMEHRPMHHHHHVVIHHHHHVTHR